MKGTLQMVQRLWTTCSEEDPGPEPFWLVIILMPGRCHFGPELKE